MALARQKQGRVDRRAHIRQGNLRVHKVLAYLLFSLGLGHLAYGLRAFKAPLLAVLHDGLIGQFSQTAERRLAFWFTIFAPMLMFAGQVALHAVARGDTALFRLVAAWVFVTALMGFAAFPRSPFAAALLLSCGLLAAGQDWI